MATYGPQDYTTFQAVNLKGSVFLRVAGSASGLEGTLSIRSDNEGLRAWQLPAKSGTFPISGTFNVQLAPATAAFFSTVVTVSGIRIEDGITVTLGERTGTTGYVFGTQGTAYFMQRAQAGNGNITLFFQNPGNATGYIELTGNYTAVR